MNCIPILIIKTLLAGFLIFCVGNYILEKDSDNSIGCVLKNTGKGIVLSITVPIYTLFYVLPTELYQIIVNFINYLIQIFKTCRDILFEYFLKLVEKIGKYYIEIIYPFLCFIFNIISKLIDKIKKYCVGTLYPFLCLIFDNILYLSEKMFEFYLKNVFPILWFIFYCFCKLIRILSFCVTFLINFIIQNIRELFYLTKYCSHLVWENIILIGSHYLIYVPYCYFLSLMYTLYSYLVSLLYTLYSYLVSSLYTLYSYLVSSLYTPYCYFLSIAYNLIEVFGLLFNLIYEYIKELYNIITHSYDIITTTLQSYYSESKPQNVLNFYKSDL